VIAPVRQIAFAADAPMTSTDAATSAVPEYAMATSPDWSQFISKSTDALGCRGQNGSAIEPARSIPAAGRSWPRRSTMPGRRRLRGYELDDPDRGRQSRSGTHRSSDTTRKSAPGLTGVDTCDPSHTRGLSAIGALFRSTHREQATRQEQHMKYRIVVLGAGYAGAYVAGNLARQLSPADTEITVVNAEPPWRRSWDA
jgi:hypothetical protein